MIVLATRAGAGLSGLFGAVARSLVTGGRGSIHPLSEMGRSREQNTKQVLDFPLNSKEKPRVRRHLDLALPLAFYPRRSMRVVA